MQDVALSVPQSVPAADVERALQGAKDMLGLRLLTLRRDDLDTADLRKLGDLIRDRAPNAMAVLASALEGKITFLAVCGAEALKRGVKAGEMIKSLAAMTGGSGGGKPESAMGGGKDAGKLDAALETVAGYVEGKVKG